MGYYPSTCPTCGGPGIFWSGPMYISCRKCEERIKLLQVLQTKAQKQESQNETRKAH
jgi:hypothetical protein